MPKAATVASLALSKAATKLETGRSWVSALRVSASLNLSILAMLLRHWRFTVGVTLEEYTCSGT